MKCNYLYIPTYTGNSSRKIEIKKKRMKGKLALLLTFVVFGLCNGGELRKRFYKKTCPAAESIIQVITWKHVAKNSTLPAKLLRMHFHDCFVRVIVIVWNLNEYKCFVSYHFV